MNAQQYCYLLLQSNKPPRLPETAQFAIPETRDPPPPTSVCHIFLISAIFFRMQLTAVSNVIGRNRSICKYKHVHKSGCWISVILTTCTLLTSLRTLLTPSRQPLYLFHLLTSFCILFTFSPAIAPFSPKWYLLMVTVTVMVT